MSKRFVSLAGVVTATAALLFAAGASAATPLPTLNVALTGAKGVSVSGSMVSGAVRVVSTFSGQLPPGSMGADVGLVRLDPGVTLMQAVSAVQSHGGDLNALTPYATLFADAGAPGTFDTVLTPGNYVALNLSGNGQPAFAQFTVTQSSSPAALPPAAATERSIEFAFRGPAVLHNGTMVRAQNDGFLVHMIDLIGVRNAQTGRKVIALLKAGKDHAAQKLATNAFVGLLGPASPGAMQEQVLNAKPGYYVEACFMNTGDGREHTQLGMARLVRIVNNRHRRGSRDRCRATPARLPRRNLMESHSSPRRWDRWIAAALLLATSAIHIALVPQHLHEAPYAGVLFIALSAGGMVTATALVLAPHRPAWLAAGALASGAVAAYVVSRSIGLPALEDDVGDWLNPLGVAALLVETATVLLCAAAGRQNRSAASRAAASARSRSDRTSPVSVGW